MLRGIYTAASGMLADQKRLDVVANNLANVSTAGFKRDTTVTQSFPELLIQRVNDTLTGVQTVTQGVGKIGFGTYVSHTSTRLTTGAMKPTGNPLDVAIAGDGFFVVNTPQGERYTRQGSFLQNVTGTLVTPEGHEVMVDGHSVSSVDPMSIADDGTVRAGGEVLGKLSVVTSQQLGAMRREGSGLWTVAGGGEVSTLIMPADATGNYQLKAGFLESSNVEAVNEMVEMMTIMRSYEANQRAIQAQDETLQRAVTEIGRIGG